VGSFGRAAFESDNTLIKQKNARCWNSFTNQ
jgi:hypothetical protein